MAISLYFIAFSFVFLLRNILELFVAPVQRRPKGETERGVPSLVLLILTFVASGFAVLYYLLFSSQLNLSTYVIGLGLFAVGYAGRLISLRTIRSGYSLFFEPRGAELVTGGVYAVVRHPIYLFYVIEMLGLLLVRPNTISLIALVANILISIYRANNEEQALLNRFGDTFTEYRRTTKKFIPFIF